MERLTNEEKLAVATAARLTAAKAEYKFETEGDDEKAEAASAKVRAWEAEIKRLKQE